MNYAITLMSRLSGVVASLGILGSATPALAVGVAAGTSIENTATATYSTGASTGTVDSNTVSITVDELLDVAVSSLDGGNVAIGSGGAVLSFRIQNAGNGPEAFELGIDSLVAGDDFDPTVTLIAYDSNGNGIYDAGVDTLISIGGSTPLIAADGTLEIFIVTALPGSVGDGDTGDIVLTATAVTGSGPAGTVFAGQGVGGSDAVVGVSTAEDDDRGTLFAQTGTVSLSKFAAISDPFGGSEPVPGASITYSLVASVTGSGSISDLILADTIPSGTTYQGGTLALDGGALTDISGDDVGEASAAGISVDLGTLAGGATNTITFTVEID